MRMQPHMYTSYEPCSSAAVCKYRVLNPVGQWGDMPTLLFVLPSRNHRSLAVFAPVSSSHSSCRTLPNAPDPILSLPLLLHYGCSGCGSLISSLLTDLEQDMLSQTCYLGRQAGCCSHHAQTERHLSSAYILAGEACNCPGTMRIL
jgi:hypothetical protein